MDGEALVDISKVFTPELVKYHPLPKWWPSAEEYKRRSHQEKIGLVLKCCCEVLNDAYTRILTATDAEELQKLAHELAKWLQIRKVCSEEYEFIGTKST